MSSYRQLVGIEDNTSTLAASAPGDSSSLAAIEQNTLDSAIILDDWQGNGVPLSAVENIKLTDIEANTASIQAINTAIFTQQTAIAADTAAIQGNTFTSTNLLAAISVDTAVLANQPLPDPGFVAMRHSPTLFLNAKPVMMHGNADIQNLLGLQMATLGQGWQVGVVSFQPYSQLEAGVDAPISIFSDHHEDAPGDNGARVVEVDWVTAAGNTGTAIITMQGESLVFVASATYITDMRVTDTGNERSNKGTLYTVLTSDGQIGGVPLFLDRVFQLVAPSTGRSHQVHTVIPDGHKFYPLKMTISMARGVGTLTIRVHLIHTTRGPSGVKVIHRVVSRDMDFGEREPTLDLRGIALEGGYVEVYADGRLAVFSAIVGFTLCGFLVPN